MSMCKRKGIAIHGISEGGRVGRMGFSDEFCGALKSWAAPMMDDETPWDVEIDEVIWAGLAQKLAPPLSSLPDVAKMVVDYLVDVVTYARNRREIMMHCEAQVLSLGPGRPMIAHSLGSVIAIDLVTKWLIEGRFAGAPETWPIAGLVTIGSPLGIDVPLIDALGFTDRADVLAALPEELALERPWRWISITDPNDVVVQGELWDAVTGRRSPRLEAHEGYRRLGVDHLPDIDTGGIISAHGGYWTHASVAQAMLELLTQ